MQGNAATSTRLAMCIKPERLAEILAERIGGYKGTVTDQSSGKVWNVYGKACDLPGCMCDAMVEPAHPTPPWFAVHSDGCCIPGSCALPDCLRARLEAAAEVSHG